MKNQIKELSLKLNLDFTNEEIDFSEKLGRLDLLLKMINSLLIIKK